MKKDFWLLAIVIILLSFLLDALLLEYIQSLRIDALNLYITSFSILTNGYFSLIVVGAVILIYKKKLLPRFLVGFGITAIISYLIKIAIRKPRPFTTLDIISLIPDKTGFSFPSGHAVFAFFSLGFIWKHLPKFGYIWLVLAILISFSRVYTGVHYVSDILAGAFIGLFLGAASSKIKLKR